MLVWAGLCVGVAFVATPAKFLAPSLTRPVALDVGRQTFKIYNRVELAGLLALAVLAVRAPRRGVSLNALAVPGTIVLVETAWLLPALDKRTRAVMTGARPARSRLHAAYITAEAAKVASLLWLGLTARRPCDDRH